LALLFVLFIFCKSKPLQVSAQLVFGIVILQLVP